MRDVSINESGNVKRVFSLLFTMCSAVSLLLCLACATMLVRSFLVQDKIIRARKCVSLVAMETSEERVSFIVIGRDWPEVRGLTWTRVHPSSASAEEAVWPTSNLTRAYWPGVIVFRGKGWFGPSSRPPASLYPVTL